MQCTRLPKRATGFASDSLFKWDIVQTQCKANNDTAGPGLAQMCRRSCSSPPLLKLLKQSLMPVTGDFELFTRFSNDLFVLFVAIAWLFDFRVSKLVAFRNLLRSLDVAVHIFHK